MSVPSWCRVGARVVCVDGSAHYWHPGSDYTDPLPVEGAVYTVTGSRLDDWFGIPRLRIAGLPNADETGFDHGWGASRFRPAVEDSGELGIETQLYRAKGRKSKSPVREPERA